MDQPEYLRVQVAESSAPTYLIPAGISHSTRTVLSSVTPSLGAAAITYSRHACTLQISIVW